MAKNNARFKRRTGFKTIRNNFLIVCEGSKTEPNYFDAFRVPKTIVEGDGFNTLSLIKYTIKRIASDAQKEIHYDQVWCVFDRDSFQLDQIEQAFDLAEQQNIQLAYSNESFELWYYLHFHLLVTGLGRKDYISKLNKLLGFKYEKSADNIYEKLLPLQAIALKNARHLHSQSKISNASFNAKILSLKMPITCLHVANKNQCPYTSVFLLVEELNKSKLK
ncbi:MAG: RloB family protein [Bacteroidia bacterium]